MRAKSLKDLKQVGMLLRSATTVAKRRERIWCDIKVLSILANHLSSLSKAKILCTLISYLRKENLNQVIRRQKVVSVKDQEIQYLAGGTCVKKTHHVTTKL